MNRVTRLGALLTLCIGVEAAAAQPQDYAAGDWQGEYICAQGSTGLTLSIAAARTGAIPTASEPVTALFRFYPVDANPSVPQGCFEMAGKVALSSRQVQLTAGRWLLHPDGYVTVDLAGRISPDGAAFDGVVYGPFCSSFTLHRLLGPRLTGAALLPAEPTHSFSGLGVQVSKAADKSACDSMGLCPRPQERTVVLSTPSN